MNNKETPLDGKILLWTKGEEKEKNTITDEIDWLNRKKEWTFYRFNSVLSKCTIFSVMFNNGFAVSICYIPIKVEKEMLVFLHDKQLGNFLYKS